ncbi:MAG: hypothetical protein Kow0037_31150 [Calditrichia bacterium]
MLASYQWIPELAGQGNSHLHHTYSYLDRQVNPGQRYVYVLADVDFSGKRHRHPALTVNYTRNGDSENLAVPDFEVLPNYPNPFNPETTIPVIVSELNANLITFQVFDLLGRKIFEDKKNITSTGKYYFHWNSEVDNTGSLSSGIYWGKIQFGNTSKYLKLLLNK